MAKLQLAGCGSKALAGQTLRLRSPPPRPGRRGTVAVRSTALRPYTIRKGDTLNSICRKRDIPLEDVLQLNPDISPDVIIAGQTILLPAGKLSERDKEIFGGIVTGEARLYPVREGETLEDILGKRGITMKEFTALNPDINVNNIESKQIIKLPSDKYTIREQEMLAGSGIMPMEFFKTNFVAVPALVFGAILGASGAYWYFKSKMPLDDD